jgi:polysaccharide biosynthesis transport protein
LNEPLTASATATELGLTEQGERGPDILEYLNVLRRRWLVILLSVVVVVAAGVFYTVRQPKVYRSTVSIIVNQNTPRPLGNEVDDVFAQYSMIWMSMEFRATQLRVIASGSVLSKVVQRLALDRDDDFLGISELPPDQAADARGKIDAAGILKGRVEASPVEGSMIVRISVKDGNPDRAARIANAIVDAYVEYTMSDRYNSSQEATAWLGDKVIEVRNNLDEAEQRLYDFEAGNNIQAVSFNDRRDILSSQLKQLATDLYNIRTQQMQQEAKLSLIRNGVTKDTLLSNPNLLNDTAVRNRLDKLIESQVLFETTALQYGERHPEYERAKKAYDSADAALKQATDSYIAQVETQLEETRKLRSLYEKELGATESVALAINRLSIKYKRLQFDVENYRRLYSALLRRTKAAQLSQRLQFSNIQLLEEAAPAGSPFYPKTSSNVMFAALIGLAVGIAMAFMVDRLDRKVKSIDEAESLIRAANLGNITRIRAEEQPQPELAEAWIGVTQANQRVAASVFPYFFPRSRVAESARVIRTNLLLMDPDSRQHVFVVTSAFPQEGKSTTTAILGTIMASLGQRVLLIDTDLRRPTLHNLIPGQNKETKGISNWITGDATLEEITHPSYVPGLDVIPCGPPPPNPTEILHSERMDELYAYAKENYAMIFYDTPPLGMVSDALVVASMVRRVVFVVDPERSDRHVIKSVTRQLRTFDSTIVGFIMNNISRELKRYGYYKGGYNRYYSYYGSYYYSSGTYQSDTQKT